MNQGKKLSNKWALISVVIGAFVAAIIGIFEIYYMFSNTLNLAGNDTFDLVWLFLWPIIIGLGAVFGLAGAELSHKNFQHSEPWTGAVIGGLFPCIILAVFLFVGMGACIVSVLATIVVFVIVIRRSYTD